MIRLKQVKTLTLCIGMAAFCFQAFCEEYPYEWVEFEGRKIKRWTITNEKYLAKEKGRELAKEEEASGFSFSEGSNLETAFAFGFTQIFTTDKNNGSKGRIYSDSMIELDLHWDFRADSFSYFVQSSIRNIKYNQGTSSIKNREESFLSAASGLSLGSKGQYRVSAGIKELPFLAINNQDYSIEKLPIAFAEIGYSGFLYEGSGWDLEYGVAASLLDGSKSDLVNAQSGFGARGLLSAEHKNGKRKWFARTLLDYRDQDTEHVEQTELDVVMALGVDFEF